MRLLEVLDGLVPCDGIGAVRRLVPPDLEHLGGGRGGASAAARGYTGEARDQGRGERRSLSYTEHLVPPTREGLSHIGVAGHASGLRNPGYRSASTGVLVIGATSSL